MDIRYGPRLGSSPLARGLPMFSPRVTPTLGIIPARAGFTLVPMTRTSASADHPRSRGVYRTRRNPGRTTFGSSPLARGLHRVRVHVLLPLGIIPARAGFTERAFWQRPQPADHPRSRGVYLFGWKQCGPGVGIIPARAGFTTCSPRSQCRCQDHPRSRGVYRASNHESRIPRGSSPLARGLLGQVNIGLDGGRIIPARAGFTGLRCPSLWYWRDHPRSRGVYIIATLATVEAGGSSPLARGLPSLWSISAMAGRIIPARAGFTIAYAIGTAANADHPRSRGVYADGPSPLCVCQGSSPLARGLLIVDQR